MSDAELIAIVAGMKVAGFYGIEVKLEVWNMGYVVKGVRAEPDGSRRSYTFNTYEGWIAEESKRMAAIWATQRERDAAEDAAQEEGKR